MVKVAFILAGCGNLDGSEIHEAVCAMLAADQQQCEYSCFALDKMQQRVVNHVTRQPMAEQRNILVESARIARGKINPITQLQVEDYDILYLVGGAGAAQNNCTYALEGENYTVDPTIANAVKAFFAAHKPICAVCIAPLIVAKVLTGVQLSLGNNAHVAKLVQDNGNQHIETASGQICVDREHKILTSPCYMLAEHLSQIYAEAEQLLTEARALLA